MSSLGRLTTSYSLCRERCAEKSETTRRRRQASSHRHYRNEVKVWVRPVRGKKRRGGSISPKDHGENGSGYRIYYAVPDLRLRPDHEKVNIQSSEPKTGRNRRWKGDDLGLEVIRGLTEDTAMGDDLMVGHDSIEIRVEDWLPTRCWTIAWPSYQDQDPTPQRWGCAQTIARRLLAIQLEAD